MNLKKGIKKYERWCLYWIGYDGEEDCYVVARNYRSARSFEAYYCGYNPEAAIAVKAASIPPKLAKEFFKRSSLPSPPCASPRHADFELIGALGGEQRETEGYTETRFNDMVFTTGSEHTILPREIGRQFLKNFRNSDIYKQFGEDDSYDRGQQILFEIMGVCLSRCQEIEFLIANSFVFCVADPQKDKCETISDWSNAWKKKKFGKMIRDIEHSFIIEEEMREALHYFKEMRNLFVHGITMNDQYHIEDSWGNDELIAFLVRFEFISRVVRKLFRSSYYASIDFGNEHFADNDKKVPLSADELEETYLFHHIFKPAFDVAED